MDSFGIVGSDPHCADPTFFYSEVFSYSYPMDLTEQIPHLLTRETQTWRSYGIGGQGPTQDTLIKDIGDDHLMRIIAHLEALYPKSDLRSLPTVWDMMHAEIAYRLQDHWQRID